MPAGRQNLNGNWFAGLRPKVITCELERQVKGRGKPNKRMEGSREKHPTNNLLWVTFLEDLEQYDKEELSLVAVANKPNANLSLQGGSNCFPTVCSSSSWPVLAIPGDSLGQDDQQLF